VILSSRSSSQTSSFVLDIQQIPRGAPTVRTLATACLDADRAERHGWRSKYLVKYSRIGRGTYSIARAGQRGGPAGQPPGAPRYKRHGDITEIVRNTVLISSRFPHEKEFLWKLSEILATRPQKRSPALSEAEKVWRRWIRRSAKLLACPGRPHVPGWPTAWPASSRPRASYTGSPASWHWENWQQRGTAD
jgi:hypothetical protein